MTFEQKFPSLKGKMWQCNAVSCVHDHYNLELQKDVMKGNCNASFYLRDIEECCLDKSKVKKAIEKCKEGLGCNCNGGDCPCCAIQSYANRLLNEMGLDK